MSSVLPSHLEAILIFFDLVLSDPMAHAEVKNVLHSARISNEGAEMRKLSGDQRFIDKRGYFAH
jgi:hypothetical protein